MPRGRLIFPLLAELARLDTEATAADPDGAGPFTSGFDDIFKETVLLPETGTPPGEPGVGVDARTESGTILVPCQVEPASFEQLVQRFSGDAPSSRVGLVFHFRDLESQSLVDAATGEPLIRKNDRLVALRKKSDQSLIQSIRNPPGLFVVEVLPLFGWLGSERNLLMVNFEEREVAVRSSG